MCYDAGNVQHFLEVSLVSAGTKTQDQALFAQLMRYIPLPSFFGVLISCPVFIPKQAPSMERNGPEAEPNQPTITIANPPLPGSPHIHVGIIEPQVGGVEALGPLIRSEKEQLKARKQCLRAPVATLSRIAGLSADCLAAFRESSGLWPGKSVPLFPFSSGSLSRKDGLTSLSFLTGRCMYIFAS